MISGIYNPYFVSLASKALLYQQLHSVAILADNYRKIVFKYTGQFLLAKRNTN